MDGGNLSCMQPIYGTDLAWIHGKAFGDFARGATPEIVRRLKSCMISVRHVLEVGCGAGALTAGLIRAGFEVTAVDSSSDLIAMARVAVPRAYFVTSSIYDFGFPECDAIVALGEPLSYHFRMNDADAVVENFFRHAHAALPKGGALIFDVIETGEPPLAGRTWAGGDDWAALVETTEDLGARELIRTIDTFRQVDRLYRRAREIHHIRLFDRRELTGRLQALGFTVETAPAYGEAKLLPRRVAFFCTA